MTARSAKPKYRFVVPGEPIPKGRPRVTNGKAYTPKRTVDAEERVLAAYLERYPGQRTPNIFTDYELHATFFRKSRRRTDVDNLAKLVMDALNGIIWTDDDQVVKLVAEKVRVTATPQTLVEIYLRPKGE